jgi:hypothetical protein
MCTDAFASAATLQSTDKAPSMLYAVGTTRIWVPATDYTPNI